MTKTHCPYCEFAEYDVIHQNDYAVILPEVHPLSKGHSVIVPLRHVSSFFDVTNNERKSLISLLEIARNELNLKYQPDGFHVAFNDGNAFAEPAEHLHIHIIPYYKGQPLQLDQRWGVISQD